MVEAQEQEEPLSEAKAGKILDAVYEKTLNGIPMVSRSVDEMQDAVAEMQHSRVFHR